MLNIFKLSRVVDKKILDPGSIFDWRVHKNGGGLVHKSSYVSDNTRIEGNSFVGKRCFVASSILGPNVCVHDQSILRESQINADSTIHNSVIIRSIINYCDLYHCNIDHCFNISTIKLHSLHIARCHEMYLTGPEIVTHKYMSISYDTKHKLLFTKYSTIKYKDIETELSQDCDPELLKQIMKWVDNENAKTNALKNKVSAGFFKNR